MAFRQKTSVIIASGNSRGNSNLRTTIKAIGFGDVALSTTHSAALDRIGYVESAVVFFDAKKTDISPVEFVERAIRKNPKLTMIALSSEPRVDDIFSLLKVGAKGFLRTPFTPDTLEAEVDRAIDGPPISEQILAATDRNAALSLMVMQNFERLNLFMVMGRENPAVARRVDAQMRALNDAVEMAKLFCEGSDDILRDKMVDIFIARAEASNSRIGKMRRELQKKRSEFLVADAPRRFQE